MAFTVVVLLAGGALAGPAMAQTTYSWTGAGSPPGTWSQSANWDASGVPPSSLTGTSLSFPALTAAACTTNPPTASCYSSSDDLGALSAYSLTIDDGLGYSLTPAGSSDTITLGAGGLTAAPSASDSAAIVGANIAIPIILGADQSWSVTGGPDNQQLELTAPVTGSAYTLGIALDDGTFLGLTGDDEVGAVTVTASGTPGTLVLGAPGATGTLNGTDHNPVTLDNGTGLFVQAGETGPLTVNGGTVQIGDGTTTPGASLLTVEGAASLSATSTLALYINDGSGSTAGTDYSQLSATGNVTLGGATLRLANFSSCPTLTVGQVYTLVQTSGGTVSGTFAGLPNGADLPLSCSSGTPPTLQIGYTSTSVTATVAPGPVSSTTSLSVAPTASVTNQPVTLTATVTPATSSPAGSVEFSDGGTPISGCTSQPVTQTGPSSYTASCTTSFAAATSPQSLTATFTSASPSLAGSTSAPVSLTVAPASTTVALQASTTSPQTGQSVTYTATVAPGVGGPAAPSGTMEFLDGGTPIGGCGAQPIVNGVATCTLAYAAAGAHMITAAYGGDPNFGASSSAAVAVTASAPPASPPPPTTTTPPPTTSPSGGGGGSATTSVGIAHAGPPKVTGRSLAETLSCSGSSAQSCRLRLALTVVETFRGKRLVGITARAGLAKGRLRRRTMTLASRSLTIEGGTRRIVRLVLRGAGPRLLQRHGTLRVELSVKQGATMVRRQTVTFRSASTRRKRK
ncbi:MAG TPA: Ig-like domain-containing protein [Solirubrobacteraceae bacterium]|nr:Ig-like domain-containing protein [Solirubrobacteraceae bacterium]